MNTGDSVLDQEVAKMADIWGETPGDSGWQDVTLPLVVPITTPISLWVECPAPLCSSIRITHLTMGQLLGTIQRLSRKIKEIDLNSIYDLAVREYHKALDRHHQAMSVEHSIRLADIALKEAEEWRGEIRRISEWMGIVYHNEVSANQGPKAPHQEGAEND